MIPSPNLDDRTFEDIVDEAIRLIPQYCPEWTNFNKSDPGITLIELFAWMSEMIIYRLNKVPEKNYLAFLDLMGIQRQPPQPSRTVLTFAVNDRSDMAVVPSGTAVSTRPTGDTGAITFETENALNAVNNQIVRCVSQYHDQFSDVTPFLDGRQPFEVFEGVSTVERYLYLGDNRLGNLGEAAIITIRTECTNPGERRFPKMLEWEYFNGERWCELEEARIETDRDSIAFWGPPDIDQADVNEHTTFWIRGRLIEVPRSPDETEVDMVTGKIEILGDGVEPYLSYHNPEGEAYLLLDLDRNVKVFGDEPGVDQFLYLASDEVLSQADTAISLDIELSDPSIMELPKASDDLLLEWQYFNGKRWHPIGQTNPGHSSENSKKAKKDPGHKLVDGTLAFTKNGSLSFDRPKDLTACEINGKEHYWIRCQIITGGYGKPGSYELVEDRWVYVDEFPLQPPSLKRMVFKFSEKEQGFDRVFIFNDFVFSDHTQLASTRYKPFQAFQPVPEENPSLYLGFENTFPNEEIQIYFNILDSEALEGRERRQKVFVGEYVQDSYDEQSVMWEYWSGNAWRPLYPKDGTHNFTGCGFIAFTAPKVHRKSRRYGDNLYWMRARLEMGGYDEVPVCDRILLNSVYASNYSTTATVTLGSSQGTPNQSFWFSSGPVLPGQSVIVEEHERPTDEDIKNAVFEERDDAFAENPNGKGYLLRWHEVESLFESGPRSRHYTKDVSTGEIVFGDGVHGMIPPKGDRNIRAMNFKVGGGQHGNVPAASIVVLESTLSHVDTVTNMFAATGGADLESIDEIKMRGPFMLKSRGRAVTREDFEWLAVQSSNSVARANCIPSHKSEGQVTVVVVPKMSKLHDDFTKKPMPSTELVRRVQAYLDERKLLTTRVNVVKPRYRELSVGVEIMRRSSGSGDRIKREIDDRMRTFLHPLKGGRDKRGWPFGRNLFKVDLYHVVEEVEGVDFVRNITIYDENKKVDVDQIRIEEHELPFLVNVEITEKAPERIR